MIGTDIFKPSRTFIIAEAGVNHNGRLELARRLVDVAREAGADAVKFQTFKAEKIVSRSAPKAGYQKKTTGAAESQFEMIKKLELSQEDFSKLKRYCDKKDILFLSTPFDRESVDFLAPLVPLYKVGSGEITNLPFLEYIAGKGKPVILSTGMSTLGEVEEAVHILAPPLAAVEASGAAALPPLILLHCVSNYPADFDEVNLSAMMTMKAAFRLPVGYSDHTLGIEVPVAAVAMGARVIEKHFTLDKMMPGPDHAASADPEEMNALVQAIRHVERALGNSLKTPSLRELEVQAAARRSLIAARDIKAGEIINELDIAIKRPGTGIPPKLKDILLGLKTTKDIKKDEPFRWEFFK